MQKSLGKLRMCPACNSSIRLSSSQEGETFIASAIGEMAKVCRRRREGREGNKTRRNSGENERSTFFLLLKMSRIMRRILLFYSQGEFVSVD